MSEFQQKLESAYAEGGRQIILGASAYGLQNPGGHLLGNFLQQHPDIEVVRLPGNMFYNPLSPNETGGFTAFIMGLTATRAAGKLRELDLSNSAYLPEQLKELTERVIADHPSLTTFNLNATGLTDEHLASMIPHLHSPVLQTLNLRHNQLTGENFAAFSEKLMHHLPALRLMDLTANEVVASSATTLEAVLEENRQLFIRLPTYSQIQTLSLRNHYVFFVPSRIDIMTQHYAALEAKFAQFEIRIQALPEIQEDANAHKKIKQLDERLTHLSFALEQHKGDFLHRLLMQETRTSAIEQLVSQHDSHLITLDQHLNEQQMQFIQLRELMESTHVQVRELETRLALTETEDRALSSEILALKQGQAELADKIDVLEESFELIKELQARLATLEASSTTLASAVMLSTLPGLSPEQQVYADHFKKILVRMYMTTTIVSTGLIKIKASGKLGKAGQVLSALSGCVPLGGSVGVKMLGYCLQAADQALVMRRMQRLSQLGNTPEDVVRLSEQLAVRLVRCLTIVNTVKENHIAQFLSGYSDVLSAFAENGFYGALTQVFEMAADATVDHVVGSADITALEERAEQDANLFLAAAAEDNILMERTRDFDRLFLYAVPLLTVVDQVFFLILDKFCQEHRFERKELHINTKKRGVFYGNITQSWHQHAAFVATSLEDDSQWNALTQQVAQEYIRQSSGVFFLKEPGRLAAISHVLHHAKHHVSWRNEALLPETAMAVMDVIITPR